jgi:hypothetical protein
MEVADALVSLGLAGDASQVRVTRRLPAPDVTRLCLGSPAGDTIWAEVAEDRAQRRSLSTRSPKLDVWRERVAAAGIAERTSLARRVDDGLLLYAPGPYERLLFDDLVAVPADGDRWSRTAATFSQLGSYLAALHRPPLDADGVRVLGRSCPALDVTIALVRGSDVDAAGAILRDELSLAPNVLEAVARADGATRVPVGLHGRFSSGAVLVGGGSFAVSGWLESWCGPRAYDLGYMVGELLELASRSEPAGERQLRAHAVGLVRAYAWGCDGPAAAEVAAQLGPYTAARVVRHLLSNVRRFGADRDTLAAALGPIDSLLPRWSAELTANLGEAPDDAR